jgi:hypothetical protein
MKNKLRVPSPTLKFEPVSLADLGVIVPRDRAMLGRAWKAADNQHIFTITREIDDPDDVTTADPFFTVHISQLDRSHRRQITRRFKTFDAAVRRCSGYTRAVRRQVAYHEAGHAVVAWMLGCSGVWVEMDDGALRAITRHDTTPMLLAVVDPVGPRDGGPGRGRAALARVLYEELMISVAGLVSGLPVTGPTMSRRTLPAGPALPGMLSAWPGSNPDYQSAGTRIARFLSTTLMLVQVMPLGALSMPMPLGVSTISMLGALSMPSVVMLGAPSMPPLLRDDGLPRKMLPKSSDARRTKCSLC